MYFKKKHCTICWPETDRDEPAFCEDKTFACSVQTQTHCCCQQINIY